jgi:hypothetical protein
VNQTLLQLLFSQIQNQNKQNFNQPYKTQPNNIQLHSVIEDNKKASEKVNKLSDIIDNLNKTQGLKVIKNEPEFFNYMNGNNERINAITNQLYRGYEEVNKIQDDITSLKNMNYLRENPVYTSPKVKVLETIKKRGRPKCSKNKPKAKIERENESENDAIQEENTKQKKEPPSPLTELLKETDPSLFKKVIFKPKKN